jgi:hypothetical protein
MAQVEPTAADAQIRKAASRAAVVFADRDWTWPIGENNAQVVPSPLQIELAYQELIGAMHREHLSVARAARLIVLVVRVGPTVALSLGVELEQVHISDYMQPAPPGFVR